MTDEMSMYEYYYEPDPMVGGHSGHDWDMYRACPKWFRGRLDTMEKWHGKWNIWTKHGKFRVYYEDGFWEEIPMSVVSSLKNAGYGRF